MSEETVVPESTPEVSEAPVTEVQESVTEDSQPPVDEQSDSSSEEATEETVVDAVQKALTEDDEPEPKAEVDDTKSESKPEDTVPDKEPDQETAIEMLKALRPRYEAHHKMKIVDDALEAAVRLSHRYVTERLLPDKAVDLQKKLIDNMLYYDGVGLSANQLGLPYRVFVMLHEGQPLTVFNPRVIQKSSDEVYMMEGCLSYPGLFIKVK